MGDNKGDNKFDQWKLVENNNVNNNSEVKKILLTFLAFVILLGSVVGGVKAYDFLAKNNEKKDNNKEVMVTPVDTNKSDKDENKVEVEKNEVIARLSKEDMYVYIHEMANTIIVPVDGKIIGTKKITENSIEKALAEAKDRDDYIYEEVTKWQQGNFDNAVEVHNYVWGKLGGTIGKADSLNIEKIEEIKKDFE